MSERDPRRRVLLCSNQGGLPVVELKLAIARALLASSRNPLDVCLAVLTASEEDHTRAGGDRLQVVSFERHRAARSGYDHDAEIRRILIEYPEENWSAVVMAERTFTDTSNLAGGSGERAVGKSYVEALVIDFVRFFEDAITPDTALVVAQTPDSLMTMILYAVARGRRVPIRGLSPAWVTPGRQPGGFLTEDEALHCPAMRRAHDARRGRPLTPDEIARADAFRDEIVTFDPNAVYKAVTGVAFGRSALSPNLRRPIAFLRDHFGRRPEIEYFKADLWEKAKANVRRAWRKRMSAHLLGSNTPDVPPRSVFLPLHFQPEASTLVGGIFHTNQIALAETILKSLPLGWTLVLKEHPAGRGSRPLAQYRHLLRFPNVVFCDAPSKAIIPRVDAVVTITGTVGIEAMALDRPVVMFGRWFWDHADVIYRATSPEDLPGVLRAVLVDRHYEKRTDRHDLIRRFFLSYLDGLLPGVPRRENAAVYAQALLGELDQLRRPTAGEAE